MKTVYRNEMVSILTEALHLTPDQVKTAREALAVVWQDKIAVVWTVDTVIELGRLANNHSPTPDQARDVLERLELDYDSGKGITEELVVQTIHALGFHRSRPGAW